MTYSDSVRRTLLETEMEDQDWDCEKRDATIAQQQAEIKALIRFVWAEREVQCVPSESWPRSRHDLYEEYWAADAAIQPILAHYQDERK